MTRRMMVLLLALALPAISAAQAQEKWPTRAVTLLVPFPPGGMADQSARPLASALEKQLKQSVVVLNRPGASGAVGIQAAAASKPDGYTILVTLVSFSTIPMVDAIFGRTPAYSVDQFEPIALLAADPPVLAVSASSPWKSVKELVDDAKKRPGEITYSHSGLYGPSHVPMEIFLNAAGVKMRQVPAVGGGPAMTMVLGGNAGMWASPPSMAVPHVKSDKLRVLASWGTKRHPAFPDAPTLKELGYDAEFYVWSGVFVPKGVPDDTRKQISSAIRAAVASDDFQNALKNLQVPVDFREGEDFRKFIAADSKMLENAIRQIGKVDGK
ncbi:tripartite tricarboxylate transporter substrate binding protein [Pseudorhodoplanes sp.]|uniref:tripartite tricarboxylate transporter substrate binding protein n=1 Tax=Pseudorhodoplanes sp. TaxID=1934341 RepID=UPI003D102E68